MRFEVRKTLVPILYLLKRLSSRDSQVQLIYITYVFIHVTAQSMSAIIPYYELISSI